VKKYGNRLGDETYKKSMATDWATKQKHRLNQTQSSPNWLEQPQEFFGHTFPRWVFCCIPVLIFLAGPQSIGYSILATSIYLIYKHLYLEGRTPSSMWQDYQQLAEQHQQSKKHKKNKNKIKNKNK
jgi:pantothenate kinase-related protein Tda10